jgi:hypothetical protein
MKSINLARGLSTLDWRGKIADRDSPDAGRAGIILATGLAACSG